MEQSIKKYIQYLKFRSTRKHSSEDEEWTKLEGKLRQLPESRSKRRVLINLIASSVAASVILAVVINQLNSSESNKETHFNLSQIEESGSTEYIKLITSSGENVELISNSSSFTYQVESSKKEKSEKTNVDQVETLITPKGKICKLVLSDGSIIHVNANSSVSYPKVFAGTERRIKVEGEVFCDVEKADKIPFYVETKYFTVKVLGTKFNVSAYNNNPNSNVVLVSGEVQLSGKGKDLKLKPRQMALLGNDELISLRNVDTSRYTSWIDGYLILKGEPLRFIFQKLEQFYGVKIVCNSNIENEQYTGKLDLSNDINDILDLIQFTVPVKYQKDGDLYTISLK